MNECERCLERLDAFHDGEAGWLARWRVLWHLRRCAVCERERERLHAIGSWIRDAESEAPDGTADLWPGIEARLGALDRTLEAGGERQPAPGWRWPGLLVPLAAGVMAALVGVAVLRSSWPAREPDATLGVVRALYPQEEPVVVLEDSSESTIIWVMDSPVDQQSEGADRVLG